MTTYSRNAVALALLAILSMTATVAAAKQQEATASPASPHQNDSEQIRDSINFRQKVVITDDQGREMGGEIRMLSADRLTLVSRRGITEIPFGSIVRIVDRPRDGLGNGALWGFGIGAGYAVAGFVTEELRGCEPGFFSSCGDPRAYLVFSLMTGGIGAAIGVGIDAAIRRERTIYRRSGTPHVRVMPTLGHGRRGTAVAVSW